MSCLTVEYCIVGDGEDNGARSGWGHFSAGNDE